MRASVRLSLVGGSPGAGPSAGRGPPGKAAVLGQGLSHQLESLRDLVSSASADLPWTCCRKRSQALPKWVIQILGWFVSTEQPRPFVWALAPETASPGPRCQPETLMDRKDETVSVARWGKRALSPSLFFLPNMRWTPGRGRRLERLYHALLRASLSLKRGQEMRIKLGGEISNQAELSCIKLE